jgi:hypothetical protein
MGRHSNIGPHCYAGLDEDSKVTTALSMRELAEQIDGLNYGTQRFLSHLVDVRRKRLAERVAAYRLKGDGDIADYVTREGDPLADGIEAMLKDGLY